MSLRYFPAVEASGLRIWGALGIIGIKNFLAETPNHPSRLDHQEYGTQHYSEAECHCLIQDTSRGITITTVRGQNRR